MMRQDIPDFAALKTRQRAARDGWPQEFALRIHRAISWIKRAEQECDDPDAAFMFLWVAFNAAYGAERPGHGARNDFEAFFLRLQVFDAENRLYRIVWSVFPGPIRLLIENPYVYAPFWSYHHGNPDAANWQPRFDAARKRFHKAICDSDTVQILSMLFDRLYVLRNQLMHGGATWGSSTNRDQIRDGAAILRNVVPVMVDLMMDAPEADWGAPTYPVVEA